jgi:acyl-CoA thioesterase I
MKLNRRKILLSATVALILILAALSVFEFFQLQTVNQIRIACVGDSITLSTQYPLNLWDSLGSRYIVGDFGIGGAAVAQTTGMSYLHLPALSIAKNFQPDIVLIMLGTNDAYTTFTEDDSAFIADYITLVSEFQSLSKKPVIYLVEPPPIYNNTISLSNEILVQKVIPNIAQVANQTGSQLIDAHTPLLNHSELYLDGVHPSADGAAVLANAIYAALYSKN